MKAVLGTRASSILYDLLVAQGGTRTFLLPANVCPIVPLTFLKAGVPFEFLDISQDTLHMDLDAALGRLSNNRDAYGGLLYVHTYGDPALPDEAMRELKHYHPGLLLIDDRCLCIPELEPDHLNVADVILYSTGYAKVVDIGIGGFAFLREEIAYRHCGLPYQPAALSALERGYKRAITMHQPYRYADSDWLETDALLPVWSRYSKQVEESLAASVEHRRAINAVYDAMLPADIRFPEDYQLWRYNIRVKDNVKVLAAVFAAGLFASSHYASLAGIFGPGSGEHAAQLAGQVMNLFNDHHYSLEMAERTAQLILRSL